MRGQSTFCFTAALISLAAAAHAVVITSPAAGSLAAPGQTISVTVDPGSTTYKFLTVVGEAPIGFSQLVSAAPYSFNVAIPAGIPALRKYSLTAIGNIAAGTNDISAPLPIDVERADSPVSLKSEIAYLETELGETTNLTLTGYFGDGAHFDVTESSKTTYSSSNPAVATVSATGAVTALSAGACKVVVNGMLVIPVLVRPTVQVFPQFVSTYPSWTRQFTAPVANLTNNTAVRWSISPAGSGSIDSQGVYTAPASVASSEYITITATSVADGTSSATATIRLNPPITATVSPSTVSLPPSQVQVFQAALTNDVNDLGDTNSGVTWSITPQGVGTILAQSNFYFVYQPPASLPVAPPQQKLTVKATSVTDPTKSATAVITLTH